MHIEVGDVHILFLFRKQKALKAEAKLFRQAAEQNEIHRGIDGDQAIGNIIESQNDIFGLQAVIVIQRKNGRVNEEHGAWQLTNQKHQHGGEQQQRRLVLLILLMIDHIAAQLYDGRVLVEGLFRHEMLPLRVVIERLLRQAQSIAETNPTRLGLLLLLLAEALLRRHMNVLHQYAIQYDEQRQWDQLKHDGDEPKVDERVLLKVRIELGLGQLGHRLIQTRTPHEHNLVLEERGKREYEAEQYGEADDFSCPRRPAPLAAMQRINDRQVALDGKH